MSPQGRLDVADTLIVFDTGIHVTGRIDCDTLYVGSLGMNVPDYVFEDGYVLRDLEQVQRFIEQYKHLPGIPSASDHKAWRKMSLTQFNKKLLEKVEEQMLTRWTSVITPLLNKQSFRLCPSMGRCMDSSTMRAGMKPGISSIPSPLSGER